MTARPARRLAPADPAYWSLLRSSPEEWQQFCWRVGMGFTARAGMRVIEEGVSIAEAVNAAIESEADDLRSIGAPASLVDAFIRDYTEARVHQMALVSDFVEMWRRVEAMPDDDTGRRKRAPRRKRSSARAPA